MARTGLDWVLLKSRGAGKLEEFATVPATVPHVLATRTAETESNRAGEREPDESLSGALAAEAAVDAPLSRESLYRHSSKVGALCASSARTDLCGGRSVMATPTATRCPDTDSHDTDSLP